MGRLITVNTQVICSENTVLESYCIKSVNRCMLIRLQLEGATEWKLCLADSDGSAKDCASCDRWQDPACAPIPIPLDDPFLSPVVDGQRRCLPFTRLVVNLTFLKDLHQEIILRWMLECTWMVGWLVTGVQRCQWMCTTRGLGYIRTPTQVSSISLRYVFIAPLT